MSGNFEGSDRKARLPKNWVGLTVQVKARAQNRCQWLGPDLPKGDGSRGRRCWKRGTEVDHKRRGDDHRLANLWLLCKGHHRAKTTREGNEAQAKPPATREQEQHPGRITQAMAQNAVSVREHVITDAFFEIEEPPSSWFDDGGH